MKSNMSSRLLSGAIVTMTLCSAAYAQQTNGSISGTVVDQQDASVPNAEVKLNNAARDINLTTTTGSEGRFFFPAILPGEYTLTVKANGFKTFEQKNLVVR